MGTAIAFRMAYLSDCVFPIGEDGAGGIQVLAVGENVVVMTIRVAAIFSKTFSIGDGSVVVGVDTKIAVDAYKLDSGGGKLGVLGDYCCHSPLLPIDTLGLPHDFYISGFINPPKLNS